MSQVQITIPVEIHAIMERLSKELPDLVSSGEQWKVEINGTKDGRIFRTTQTNAEIITDKPGRKANRICRT